MEAIVRHKLRLTADKREIKDFPKLPSATSFIRETLSEMLALGDKNG
jgi:hypothetical protein